MNYEKIAVYLLLVSLIALAPEVFGQGFNKNDPKVIQVAKFAAARVGCQNPLIQYAKKTQLVPRPSTDARLAALKGLIFKITPGYEIMFVANCKGGIRKKCKTDGLWTQYIPLRRSLACKKMPQITSKNISSRERTV